MAFVIPFKRPTGGMRPQGIPVLNRDHFFAKNLKGWWPRGYHFFANTLIDYSGNGNHLTHLGLHRADSFLVHPNLGYGGHWQEQEENVDKSYQRSDNMGVTNYPMTFALWGQPVRLGRTTTFVSFANGGAATPRSHIGTTTGNLWNGDWQGSSSSSVDTFDFNNPSMIVWSVESAERREFYVNGLLNTANTTTEAYDVHNNFRIGSRADSTPNNPLEGKVWEVAFWNRTLNASEIWEMWNAETRWDHYWKPKLYISIKSITQDIEGSSFTDIDTFNEGFVQPIGMLGSNVEDTDILFQGDVDHDLFGSILTDVDTLNDGLITLNVESSFLSDADILNHGELEIGIAGSLLEDTDTFNQGEAISAGQLQGSILVDTDTFFDSRIVLPMFGSILEDADTLNQGTLFIDIMGFEIKLNESK